MNKTQCIRFVLSLSSDDYRAYYTGSTKSVLAKSHDGRMVKFPASVLQQFLTHEGIHGLFEMEIDQNNKFISIRKLDQKHNGNGIWL
jgi:hypothetical protein